VLAAAEQVLDARALFLALELGPDDLVHVQEAVALEADLDEGGLHSGQDVVDDAEVDVPGDRAALGALEVDLCDAVVLEDGDPLLAHVDGDEQLALRRRQRCAAGRRATPLTACRALLALLCPSFLCLGADGLDFLLRCGGRYAAGLGAALASARAAAALGPCRCLCVGSGRDCGRLVRCFGDWSGRLYRRLLPLRLAPAKPVERQKESSLSARAAA
jgi:hypothetical protein